MDDYQSIFKRTSRVEKILVDKFGAEGGGLKEKVTSVEPYLPTELIKKTLAAGRIRNRLAHDPDYEFNDMRALRKRLDDIIEELDSLDKPSDETKKNRRDGVFGNYKPSETVMIRTPMPPQIKKDEEVESSGLGFWFSLGLIAAGVFVFINAF